MIWVCRSGRNSCYYSKYIEKGRIYLPWDGYNLDLSKYALLEEFRPVVAKEKETDNRTSISNWAGQLFSFVKQMNVDDYVLIPTPHSLSYTFGRITGEYQYCAEDSLHHSRSVEIIKEHIPRTAFPQYIQYSLGAYRTVFHPRYMKKK